jgi:hypothetical protein
MFWIYQGIVGLVTALVCGTVLREKTVSRQLAAGVVLVVLLLRLFLVK